VSSQGHCPNGSVAETKRLILESRNAVEDSRRLLEQQCLLLDDFERLKDEVKRQIDVSQKKLRNGTSDGVPTADNLSI
jgi:hypothetical protein